MIEEALMWLEAKSPVARAFYLSLVPALATAVGSAIGALLRPKEATLRSVLLDAGLSFSAGVMLVVSLSELLFPSIEIGGIAFTTLGFLLGVVLVLALDKLVPHEHLVRGYHGPVHLASRLKSVWLVVLAIIIHNIPEGVAVGGSSSFGTMEGVTVSLAIALQDVPEGFAVTFPLVLITGRVLSPFLLGVLSGFSETFAAVISAAVAMGSVMTNVLTMSLAGGAMVYVVSHEILPETLRKGRERAASAAFIIGFLTALSLRG